MSLFELIPAIDLLGGQCVRLSQGRYDDATVYDGDPGKVAGGFREAGVTRIHVVDLDGAKAGRPVNREAIAHVVAAAGGVPVQLGGGLRDLAGIEAAFEDGVQRAILGTVALRDPELVKSAAKRWHPGRIVVGIDARDGHGRGRGLARVERDDGRRGGPPLRRRGRGRHRLHRHRPRRHAERGRTWPQTAELADALTIPVIVSGGVASETDIVRSRDARAARHLGRDRRARALHRRRCRCLRRSRGFRGRARRPRRTRTRDADEADHPLSRRRSGPRGEGREVRRPRRLR